MLFMVHTSSRTLFQWCNRRLKRGPNIQGYSRSLIQKHQQIPCQLHDCLAISVRNKPYFELWTLESALFIVSTHKLNPYSFEKRGNERELCCCALETPVVEMMFSFC
mmetsp:Transcript_314/g.2508  ORF Transcript_314/g.2508 Transcript_314/m.2508 type:complete len:107 (-) Transcript_314:720-1040(-)